MERPNTPTSEELNEKLAELRTLEIRRGLNKVASPADLAKLEEEIGVTLPEEFRTFLLEVGYGEAIRSPFWMAWYHDCNERWSKTYFDRKIDAQAPFPITAATARELAARVQKQAAPPVLSPLLP